MIAQGMGVLGRVGGEKCGFGGLGVRGYGVAGMELVLGVVRDLGVEEHCVLLREGLIRNLAKPNYSPLRGRALRGLRCFAAFEPEGSHQTPALPIRKKGPLGPFLVLAVREGFEPSIRFRIHTFQACSFDHSDTSP